MKKYIAVAIIAWTLWLGYEANGQFEWQVVGIYEYEEDCEIASARLRTANTAQMRMACVEG